MSRSRWERPRACSGALAVVLFGCGLLFGDLLGPRNYPPADASPAVVRGYFLHGAAEVRALSFFHALAALALACFAAYLYARVHRHRSGLAALALGGGLMAAAFLLASALCYRTLAEPTVARDAALAHALLVLSYLTGGQAISISMVLPVSAGSILALGRTLLPRWTGWLGVLAVVTSVASAGTLLAPLNNRSPFYGILLLAAILGFGWVLVSSIALARQRPERDRPATGSRQTRARD